MIVFRRADIARDASGILNAHRTAVRTTAAPFYSPDIVNEWARLPITTEMINAFIAQKNQGETITVAESSGEIVGFSEVVPARNELRAVYVHPDFNRRGVGGHLLRHAEEIALTHSCPSLHLHASLNAREFYERNGYKVLHPGEHLLKSGRKMDCFIMEKFFDLAKVKSPTNSP